MATSDVTLPLDEETTDEDIDAEAEEIARKLFADINAGQVHAPSAMENLRSQEFSAQDVSMEEVIPKPDPEFTAIPPTQDSTIETAVAVMGLLSLDKTAQSILSSCFISPSAGNALEHVQRIASSRVLPDRGTARNLAHALLSLVKSDVLVLGDSTNTQSRAINAMSTSAEKRKREDDAASEPLAKKARSSPPPNSSGHLRRTIQSTHATFDKKPSLSPSDMLALHVPFQQVFTFAVSSSRFIVNPLGHEASALQLQLQEISGLVQVIGVLSGISFVADQPKETTVFPFCAYTRYLIDDRVMVITSSTNAINVHSPLKTRYFNALAVNELSLDAMLRNGHIDSVREKLRVADISGNGSTPAMNQGAREQCAESEIVEVEQSGSSAGGMDKFAVSTSSLSAPEEDLEDGEIPRSTMSLLYGTVLGLAGALRGCVNSGGALPTVTSPQVSVAAIASKTTLGLKPPAAKRLQSSQPVLQLAPPSVTISPPPTLRNQEQAQTASIEGALRSVIAYQSSQKAQNQSGRG
ncbi:hypothetical protein DL96DRAFT_1702134 [Flagelloscypha sp. PMI_526]|nr:hypothetical protein DL96DRAFT_1702134 [Flagelloscypha sp. PMI_526]